MKMIKFTLLVLLAGLVIFPAIGCGGSGSSDDIDPASNVSATVDNSNSITVQWDTNKAVSCIVNRYKKGVAQVDKTVTVSAISGMNTYVDEASFEYLTEYCYGIVTTSGTKYGDELRSSYVTPWSQTNLWSRSFSCGSTGVLYGVTGTGTGGFVGVGYIMDDNIEFSDGWLAFFTSDGELTHEKRIGGAVANNRLYSVVQTTDGNYVAVGSTTSLNTVLTNDCWAVKFDATGTLLWQKAYSGTDDDRLTKVIATDNGGVSACGEAFSNAISSIVGLEIALDTNGSLIWSKFIAETETAPSAKTFDLAPGTTWCEVSLSTKIDTLNGGTIQAGRIDDAGFLLKRDSNGDIEWQYQYFDTTALNFTSITEVSGGYVVVGYTDNSVQNTDICVIMVDESGNLLWQKYVGSTGNDYAQCVIAADNGNVIVSGVYSGARAMLLEFDEYGYLQNQAVLSPTTGMASFFETMFTSNGDLVSVGFIESTVGCGWDNWIIRLDSCFGFDGVSSELITAYTVSVADASAAKVSSTGNDLTGDLVEVNTTLTISDTELVPTTQFPE